MSAVDETIEFLLKKLHKTFDLLIAVFEFPVVVEIWRGPLRRGPEDKAITMLYVGRSANAAHLKNKYFNEAETVKSLRANLFNFRRHLAAEQDKADVVFVDVGNPYHKGLNKADDYLVLRDWVFLSAPLAQTWDGTVQNFRKTMRKNIRRLIRKNNYRCEPTNDPEITRKFYDDFYTAFINSRYNDETVMTPRWQVDRCLKTGVLLQVIGDDGPVAAGVYFPMKGEFCLLASGMPEALVDNPPEAAVSALYYFSMQYAFEQGYKSVNFLGTRPFPDDGLFQFKRKWGAEIKDDFTTNTILFKPMNTEMAAQFCELHPMFAKRGDGFELVICSTAPTLSHSDCSRLVEASNCPGIDAARIIHLAGQATGTTCSEPNIKVVGTSLEAFCGTYTNAGSQTGPEASKEHEKVTLPSQVY